MAGPEIISHWHHSVEDFSTSSLEFYRAVEDTLKNKEAPTVHVDHIDWLEGGALSAKREYLRVAYGRFSFEICAAPFGKDFFFSWWLTRRKPDLAALYVLGALLALFLVFALLVKVVGFFGGVLLFLIALAAGWAALMSAVRRGATIIEDVILAAPLLGFVYGRFLRPTTYYSEDTRLVFEESVHRVVLHHVDALLNARGARALAPEEAKPESRMPRFATHVMA